MQTDIPAAQARNSEGMIMDKLIEKLEYAKDSVRWLLDHGNGLVDFHGIAYWAAEIERLRDKIKEV